MLAVSCTGRRRARYDAVTMSVPDESSSRKQEDAELRRQWQMAKHRETAQAWWDSGRQYYVVTLSLGGTTTSFSGDRQHEGEDVSGALQQIEAVGWVLRDIGYVYQPMDERAIALARSSALTGNIRGIYTFMRPEASAQAPPV